METRSARIGSLSNGGGVAVSIVGIIGCGLWVLGVVTPASAQTVRNTVEQRMDAGAAAVSSAADSAEVPSQAAPEPQASSPASSLEPSGAPSGQPSGESSGGPSGGQPAEQVQPTPAEQPANMTTTGDSNQPEAASQPAPPAQSPEVHAGQASADSQKTAPSASPAPSEASASTPDQVETAKTEMPSAPPTYTVKPGDTLWSISSLHLSDPFDWPKLWNVNPTVANPDLIYPGNVLMLPNGQPVEAVQTPTPPVAEAPPAEEAPEEAAAAPSEEEAPPPTPEERQVIAKQNDQEQQAPELEVSATPPAQSNEILALSSGFIAKSLPVAARVVGTHENRVLLGDHDAIYLLPSPGTTLEEKGRYTIYRRIKQVVHPVSKRVVGDLIRILGEVEVQEVGPVSTGMIVKSFAGIEPGDDVMPAQTMEAAPTTPVVEGAGGSLSGLILAVLDQHYIAGQFDVVYIDRGESSGVVVGDHFRVFRRGQRAPAYAPIANIQLPDRLVGEIEVLSVQGETATALLTRTSETIALGDRIER